MSSGRYLYPLLILLFWIGLSTLQSCDELFAQNPDRNQNQPVSFSEPDPVLEPDPILEPDPFPDPDDVFFRSLIVPGWGQVINDQSWKVPVIAGALAGVAIYSVYLDREYRDYRAAFYNASRPDSDEKFGPTPTDLINVNINQLRSNRNTLRNRRDFMIVMFGAAYLLQGVDAYVYAHMRSFDVSDDLSIAPSIRPDILASNTPGVTLRLDFYSRK